LPFVSFALDMIFKLRSELFALFVLLSLGTLPASPIGYDVCSIALLIWTRTQSSENNERKQKAQLPFRNRASAKLLSIAYDLQLRLTNHLRSLRPMIRLICYAHSAYTSACDVIDARMTRDPTVV